MNAGQPSETSLPNDGRNGFLILALAWLALPDLIFLTTWIRPWIGIPTAILVTILLCRMLKFSVPEKILRRPLSLALMTALFWTLFGGVGGFLPQSSDYIKHNLLFHDLINQSWPVNYSDASGSYYLCYGLSYYLVPALGGKIIGGALVPLVAFTWTFIGLAIFFYWLATLGNASGKTLAVFLLFAVTGTAWLAFKRLGIPGEIGSYDLKIRLVQQGLYNSYYDNFTRFQYQPQHALPGWLGAAVMYELLWLRKNPRGVVLAWALCLFWSPMSCLGLLMIPLAALPRLRWQSYFEPINVIGGGLLILIAGIYFTGHVKLDENSPIWSCSPGNDWPLFLLLFIVLELMPLLFIYLVDRRFDLLGDWRPLFFAATFALLILPCWKVGHYGDLRTEASGPALLFAALAACRCLQPRIFSLKQPLAIGLAAILVLGATYPLVRPWLIFQFKPHEFSYESTVALYGYHDLREMRDSEFDSSTQYLGRTNSPAARWLLKRNPDSQNSLGGLN